MADEAPQRTRRPRWLARTLRAVPFLVLAVAAIGFFRDSTARRPWQPLEVAAPPRAALPALERPSARRELSGRVVDPDGAPVEEALVTLTGDDVLRWTYTDSDGGFRLPGLRAGLWTVSVVARGHDPLSARVETSESKVFRELRLGPRVPPPPSLPSVKRSPLRGRVLPATALALAGLEVELLPTLPPHELGGPLPRRVAVDADGAFALQDLAAGEYFVQVLPSWARGGSWPDLARPFGAPLERLHVQRAGRDELLEVPLANGALRGALTDGDGAALEGALVLVTPEGEPEHVWPPATTAADGTFEVSSLPAGTYRVRARAGAALVEQAVDVRAGEVVTVDLGPLATR